MALVHNYPNQQLRARASSLSWGGSPTSFLTRNTCFVENGKLIATVNNVAIYIPHMMNRLVVKDLYGCRYSLHFGTSMAHVLLAS